MSRILAIDYGRKRTGIAVSDPMQMIANGLTTVPTHQLLQFLLDYVAKEPVERILVGLPKQMNNEASENMRNIEPFVRTFVSGYFGYVNSTLSMTAHLVCAALIAYVLLKNLLRQKNAAKAVLVLVLVIVVLMARWKAACFCMPLENRRMGLFMGSAKASNSRSKRASSKLG